MSPTLGWSESGASLLPIERDIGGAVASPAVPLLFVKQALHGLTVAESDLDDLFDICRRDLHIEQSLWLYGDQRSHLAEALAAALGQAHIGRALAAQLSGDIQSCRCDRFHEGFVYLDSAIGHTPCTSAENYTLLDLGGGRSVLVGHPGQIGCDWSVCSVIHYAFSSFMMSSIKATALSGVT